MPDATEPLRHELQIAAPPEVVFAYFTDPGRMVEWMVVGALLDPRPGGALRIDANGRDVVVGEYLELEPPRRLVFTWGFDGDGRATGAGSCSRGASTATSARRPAAPRASRSYSKPRTATARS